MGYYKFYVDDLMKKYTKEQLADLYIGEKMTNRTLRDDNSDLRSENETLRYLIAKYQIGKENEQIRND